MTDADKHIADLLRAMRKPQEPPVTDQPKPIPDLLQALRDRQGRHARLEERQRHGRHLDRALIATLSAWLDYNRQHESPESFHASVLSNTGLMGGDVEHGGKLAIRFETDSGSNAISFRPFDKAEVEEEFEGQVTLLARGDWEQTGLIASLAHLLRAVLEPSRSREPMGNLV